MRTTQPTISNENVLEAVRQVVVNEDRLSHVRGSAAVMRAISYQKAADRAKGIETATEDNWLLLISAASRGDV